MPLKGASADQQAPEERGGGQPGLAGRPTCEPRRVSNPRRLSNLARSRKAPSATRRPRRWVRGARVGASQARAPLSAAGGGTGPAGGTARAARGRPGPGQVNKAEAPARAPGALPSRRSSPSLHAAPRAVQFAGAARCSPADVRSCPGPPSRRRNPPAPAENPSSPQRRLGNVVRAAIRAYSGAPQELPSPRPAGPSSLQASLRATPGLTPVAGPLPRSPETSRDPLPLESLAQLERAQGRALLLPLSL